MGSGRPPHRTGRAALLRPVLTLDSGVERIGSSTAVLVHGQGSHLLRRSPIGDGRGHSAPNRHRSVNGRTSDWFRGVQSRHEGQIKAGGVVKDVTFIEVTDENVNAQIDAAYADKYRRYASIIPSINDPKARAATIRIVPRSTGK